jgi:phosphoglycerate dehydrogenase-like enzyme
MISAKSFPKMKKGVLIINCARGEIVHTADMVAALQSGQVGGYGTDVLDEEPPTPNHPLLKLPNVVVTPHVGSRTYESVVRQATAAVENLTLVRSHGEKLLSPKPTPRCRLRTNAREAPSDQTSNFPEKLLIRLRPNVESSHFPPLKA